MPFHQKQLSQNAVRSIPSVSRPLALSANYTNLLRGPRPAGRYTRLQQQCIVLGKHVWPGLMCWAADSLSTHSPFSSQSQQGVSRAVVLNRVYWQHPAFPRHTVFLAIGTVYGLRQAKVRLCNPGHRQQPRWRFHADDLRYSTCSRALCEAVGVLLQHPARQGPLAMEL